MHKHKKKIIIGCVAAIAVIGLGAAVSAGIWQIEKNKYDPDLYYTDDAVQQTSVYTQTDGSKTALTYQHSLERSDGSPLHYYLDAEGNQYSFDAAGELIGYTPSKEQAASAQTEQAVQTEQNSATAVAVTADAEATETEQPIIAQARQFAIQTYGEEYFSKFSYSMMHYDEALNKYDVYFYIRYKERFVTERCIVSIRDDALRNITIAGKGIDEGFDETLLNKVEISTLEAYVAQKVKDEFTDGYISYEIENNIAISKNDEGKYELVIVVSVKTDPELSGTPVEYTYALE